MPTPTFKAWKQAHEAATDAEQRLLLRALAHLNQSGSTAHLPPELVEDAVCKRARAQAAFEEFLQEIDRMRAALRHEQSSVDLALRLAQHTARRKAGAVPPDAT